MVTGVLGELGVMMQLRFPLDMVSVPLHDELLGVSAEIREVRQLIDRLAQSNLTILITGESGTGKDIAARMLHRHSPRASRAFIKVNCPAIPEAILESELFGYEKGAFTGARASKPGRLELAHGGSIFLDEIAEMPYAVQGKLLQVLDGEPIMRIGGVTPIQCDVRMIAATNVDLEKAVREERMREDIYFRLSEVHIHIPPLRERPEDIPLLAEHFNYSFLLKTGREYTPIAEEHLERMLKLPWRGNVRELAACVKKYATSGDPETLFGETRPAARDDQSFLPSALVSPRPAARPQEPAPSGMGQLGTGPVAPPRPATPEQTPSRPATAANRREPKQFPPLKEAARKAVEETERKLIEEALQHTLWNRRKAAKLLQISYSSLLRRIEAYNIGE